MPPPANAFHDLQRQLNCEYERVCVQNASLTKIVRTLRYEIVNLGGSKSLGGSVTPVTPHGTICFNLDSSDLPPKINTPRDVPGLPCTPRSMHTPMGSPCLPCTPRSGMWLSLPSLPFPGNGSEDAPPPGSSSPPTLLVTEEMSETHALQPVYDCPDISCLALRAASEECSDRAPQVFLSSSASGEDLRSNESVEKVISGALVDSDLGPALSTSAVAVASAGDNSEQSLNSFNGDLRPVWLEKTSSMRHTFEDNTLQSPRTGGMNALLSGGARSGDMIREAGGFVQPFVVRPTSPPRLVWELLIMIVMAYDVLIIPMQVFDLPETPLTRHVTMATTIFWSLDMVSSFLTGFNDKGFIEMRPTKIAKQYFKTYLLLDVMVVMTDWSSIILSGGEDQDDGTVGLIRMSKSLRAAKMLRLLRLLRIVKVLAVLASLTDLINSEGLLTILGLVKLVVFIAIINHFIACGWYGVAFLGIQPRDEHDRSWVHAMVENEMRDPSLGYFYTSALHWSLTQFLGSMEVVPRNSVERVYAILVLMFALAMLSSFVSGMTNAMAHLREVNLERQRQLDAVRRFIVDHRISIDLGNRIHVFIRKHSKAERRIHEEDVDLFHHLPGTLIEHIRMEVYMPTLATHPLFHQLVVFDESGAIDVCKKVASERSFISGREVFACGSEANAMHIVVEGVLQYFAGVSTTSPVQVNEGDYISEAALWVLREHAGRLLSSSTCELITLDAPAFGAVMYGSAGLAQCRTYARMFIEDLLETEEQVGVSDVRFNFDAAQTIAQKAFEEHGGEASGSEADNHSKRFKFLTALPDKLFFRHSSSSSAFQRSKVSKHLSSRAGRQAVRKATRRTLRIVA